MTLTLAAKFTKIAMFVSITAIVVGLIGWIGYQIYYYQYYLPNLPVKEEVADAQFGVLPKLLFPGSDISPTNYSYSIDTATGNLPANFPKIVKVFFLPQLGTTLLAPSRAKDLARSFGFESSPALLTSTLYRFSNNQTSEMVVDITSGNFQYQKLATPSANLASLPDDNSIKDQFLSFLGSKNLLRPSLQNGRTALSRDQVVTVSVWPQDLEGLPIVTSSYEHGLVKAELSKLEETDPAGGPYSKLEYTFWEPDMQKFATYEVKNSQIAFEDLKQNKGVVLEAPQGNNVSLSNVYLAYFQSGEYTPFIQPIYVFEGQDFIAYVPAVVDQYLEK